MHELYELKDKLLKELEEYGQKEMSAGSLDVIDKLSHAIKNICKIIEAYEMEGEEYSMRGGQGGGNRYSYEGGEGRNYGGGGGRYSREGGYRYSRDGGGSYARGRGRNAPRDSMGRFAGGYSRTDGMEELVEKVREMMQDLPQNLQQDAQKFVQKLEQEM